MKCRIACCQTDSQPGNKQYNLSRGIDLLRKAGSEEAKLAVFPELWLTGYSASIIETLPELAEEIPGPATEQLGKVAAEYGMYVIAGMVERDLRTSGVLYNTAVLIDNKGAVVGKYRKTHLVTYLYTLPYVYVESEFFRQGDDLPVFETDFGAIGILICQDTLFPETSRVLTLKGAKIIVTIFGSPKQFADVLPIQSRICAIQNGTAIVAVNQVGKDQLLDYKGKEFTIEWHGGSHVVDPFGNVIKRGKLFEEDLVIADLETDDVFKARWESKFLRDRRPELYAALTEREST